MAHSIATGRFSPNCKPRMSVPKLISQWASDEPQLCRSLSAFDLIRLTVEPTEHTRGFSYAPDLKQLAYRDLLDKVFNGNGNGSTDNERDWHVLKLSMDFEVEEIADQLGMAVPKVRYRLKKSEQRFRMIAKHRHKFSRSDI
jgi:hypothetical protein